MKNVLVKWIIPKSSQGYLEKFGFICEGMERAAMRSSGLLWARAPVLLIGIGLKLARCAVGS